MNVPLASKIVAYGLLILFIACMIAGTVYFVSL